VASTAPDLDGLLTSDVDAEFLALVCSDEGLLDAEFQALVAGLEPPSRPAAPPQRQGDRGAGTTPSGRARAQAVRVPGVRRPTTGRERSPP
jgi:hypothetical protein